MGMRPIPFAPRYLVSDDGRVSSEKCGRYLKPWLHRGYPCVSLCIDGVVMHLLVHRLVLLSFVGSPPTPQHETRHLDGNPGNPALTNLVWGTHAENMQDTLRHGTHIKFKPEKFARGMRNAAKTRPETFVRGERVTGSKLKPADVMEIRRRASSGTKNVTLVECLTNFLTYSPGRGKLRHARTTTEEHRAVARGRGVPGAARA